MLTAPVAGLLEKLWPAIDPTRIELAEQRFTALAQHLSDLQAAMSEAAAHLAATGDGHTANAMTDQARRIADGDLTAVIDRLGHHAEATRAYGDAVDETQQRLTVVAAMADRDLLAARVVAAATGDTTGLVGAHDSAARVMTAAAGHLDWKTRALTDDLEAQSDSPPGQAPPGHAPSGGGGAPMMAPMGGAISGAVAGAMMHARGGEQVLDLAVADADLAMLRSRAAHLAAIQPPEVAPWIRLAVGLGVAGDGRHVVVVGTSEWGGYLRPGSALEPHESVVGDGRPPELAIMGYFTDRDIGPVAVCSAMPPSAEVAAQIAESGAQNLGLDDDEDQDGDP